MPAERDQRPTERDERPASESTLRQYFSALGRGRSDRHAGPGEDRPGAGRPGEDRLGDDRPGTGRPGAGRPGRRSVILPALAVVVAMAAGLALGLAIRSDRASAAADARSGATTTRPAASPECVAAVRRADASLAKAVQVQKALAEHTEYMNLLLEGKITPRDALTKGMPSIVQGASQSAQFDVALADYRRVVGRCKLQQP